MFTFFAKKFHHYLLPHESNNYRAKVLHNSSVIFYLILLVVFQFSINFIKHVRPNVLGYATDITLEKLITLVNQKRIEANLAPLSLSDQLSTAATQKAQDMFGKDYWAHISPTGITPWAFITSSGYEYLYAGENLARNFDSADEVINAWMNSPSHRANILKPEYQDIGLAIMNGKLNGEDITLVVQEFGAKANVEVIAAPPGKNTQPDDIIASSHVPARTEILIGNKIRTSTITSFIPTFNKSFSLLLAEFLLVVLFIDSIYLWKHKTSRLSSHSLAHIIFLGALTGAMGATGIGAIL